MERDIDRGTVRLYVLAVEELAKEGDESAKVAWNYLMMKSPDSSYRYSPDFVYADATTWASNIHHNIQGISGLSARLKTRVMLMRLKGET